MLEGTIISPGMMAYACKPAFGSQEAGGSQPKLQSETLSDKKKFTTEKVTTLRDNQTQP